METCVGGDRTVLSNHWQNPSETADWEETERYASSAGSVQVRQLMKRWRKKSSSISLRSGRSIRDAFVSLTIEQPDCVSEPLSPHHLLLLLQRPSRPRRQALRFWRRAPPTHTIFLFTPDGNEWRVETRHVFFKILFYLFYFFGKTIQ